MGSGADGIRTHDLLRARQALSQLSYRPKAAPKSIRQTQQSQHNATRSALTRRRSGCQRAAKHCPDSQISGQTESAVGRLSLGARLKYHTSTSMTGKPAMTTHNAGWRNSMGIPNVSSTQVVASKLPQAAPA